MTPQLLVTGCYRTGSTYTALLLHNLYRANGGAVGLHTTNYPREMHSTVGDALEYAEKRWGITTDETLPGAERPAQRWDQVMRALVGSPWCEKTNLNWNEIPQFLSWFPQGKALLIVRDPRSVLASFKRYCKFPEPASLGAPFNCLGAMQWAEEHTDWGPTGPTRIMLMTYEQVASAPGTTMEAMSRWFEVDYPGDDVILDQSDWPDVPGSRWQDRSSFTNAEDIDVDKAINRWKGNLEPWEIRFTETICGDVMERFGYETTSSRPMENSELRALVQGDERVEKALEHWIATGEGSCFFARDPSDSSTWQENKDGRAA